MYDRGGATRPRLKNEHRSKAPLGKPTIIFFLYYLLSIALSKATHKKSPNRLLIFFDILPPGGVLLLCSGTQFNK